MTAFLIFDKIDPLAESISDSRQNIYPDRIPTLLNPNDVTSLYACTFCKFRLCHSDGSAKFRNAAADSLSFIFVFHHIFFIKIRLDSRC